MAKINTSCIEGYENMTPDQKVAALEAYEYEDNSAEVTRLKGAVTNANKEAADWKRKHNALLTEDEQKKQADAEALAAMQSELEELRMDKKVSDYKASFISQGYSEELAASSAKALASGDTKTVFENNQKFIDQATKAIKADVLKSTPRPSAGFSTSGQDYRKMIDDAEARGDIATASYYTRLQAQAQANPTL